MKNNILRGGILLAALILFAQCVKAQTISGQVQIPCTASIIIPLAQAPITDAFISLNCYVTSSTVTGSPQSGTEVTVTITNTGSFSFAWPANFLNTPTVPSSGSAAATFQFCGFVGLGLACPANSWQNTDQTPFVATIPGTPVVPSLFGVKSDGRSVNDASVTSGQPTVTSTLSSFTQADTNACGGTGRFVFTVRNIAAGTVDIKGTIISVAGNVATLNANATATFAGEQVYIGCDDTAAWILADVAALNQNRPMSVPCGMTLISDTPMSFVDFSNFVPATNTAVPINQTFYWYGPDSGCAQFVISPNFNFTSSRNGNGSVVYGGNCNGCGPILAINSAPGWNVQGYLAKSLTATALGQTFAGLAGKSIFFWIGTQGLMENIQIQKINSSGGVSYGILTNNESEVKNMNCQNATLLVCIRSASSFTHILNGVYAFVEGFISNSGSNQFIDVDSAFVTQISPTSQLGVIAATSGAFVNIKGGWYDVLGNGAGHVGTYVDGTSYVNFFPTETNCNTMQTLSGGILRMKNVKYTEQGGGCATTPWLNNAGSFFNDGGNSFIAPGTAPVTNTGTYVVSPDGLQGACTGVATAAATLGLYGIPGVTGATSCTNATIAGAVSKGSKTLMHLFASSTAAGTNASSGVVTVMRNGVSTSITCTIGTGTSCSDTSHVQALSAGDIYSIQFTTQAADTLAGVKAQVDVN